MMQVPCPTSGTIRWAQLLAMTLSLLVLATSSLISCQDSADPDGIFTDFHQDLGRISGGAPATPVAQTRAAVGAAVAPLAPAIGQTQQQVAPKLAARASGRSGGSNNAQARYQPEQHSHSHPAQPAPPKRNRITLAVRQHTPAPTPVAQLEPALQNQLVAPLPITQPIAAPLQPLAPSADLYQEAPSSNQFASLMAQVAAERQASGQGQPEPLADLPAASGPVSAAVQVGGGQSNLRQVSQIPRQPQASVQSASAMQVIAPPAAASYISEQPAAILAGSSSSSTNNQLQLQPLSQPSFGEQPEEQIEAPSFQHVLSNGCPRKGVYSWENKDHCDRYYMCTNGTFTEEACPNGLSYSQLGAVYQHCAYNWNIDCGKKKAPGPLASPGCPWQFGIFPVSGSAQCSIDYLVCEWGVPEKKRCQPEGLFYDDRIKGCQWADQLGCKSEALLNFKCPSDDEENPFWPYPRYYHTKQDVIVCVNEQPRLVHCTEDQVVEPSSLSCLDLKKKKLKKP